MCISEHHNVIIINDIGILLVHLTVTINIILFNLILILEIVHQLLETCGGYKLLEN